MNLNTIRDHFWCEKHCTVHRGEIQKFSMKHRMHLHPVYADINVDRLRSAAGEGGSR